MALGIPVVLHQVTKVFPGGIEAVSSISLALEAGEFLAVVGQSGSGKSTLLRLIAGLERPDAGEVWIGARRADRFPPWKRNAAMVFQQPAVYPFLNVFDNLAFGLKTRDVSRVERRRRVEAMAARLGLSKLLARRPDTLSGGERQRVALGRALVRRPEVLLLDEPFSALDTHLRTALRLDLIELHRHTGTTTVHVTHDQAEALALGDRVVLMDRGRISQIGTPGELYEHPATREVAGFIGNPPMNLLPCQFGIDSGRLQVRLGDVCLDASVDDPRLAPISRRCGGRVVLGIRPEHIRIVENANLPALESGVAWIFRGQVEAVERLGYETLGVMKLLEVDGRLTVRFEPGQGPQLGQTLILALDRRRIAWFDLQSGRNLAEGTSQIGGVLTGGDAPEPSQSGR